MLTAGSSELGAEVGAPKNVVNGLASSSSPAAISSSNNNTIGSASTEREQQSWQKNSHSKRSNLSQTRGGNKAGKKSQ